LRACETTAMTRCIQSAPLKVAGDCVIHGLDKEGRGGVTNA